MSQVFHPRNRRRLRTVFNPPGESDFEAGEVLSAIGSEESLLRLKLRAGGEEVVAEHTAALN
jgi:uncharacterized transporter YbjL